MLGLIGRHVLARLPTLSPACLHPQAMQSRKHVKERSVLLLIFWFVTFFVVGVTSIGLVWSIYTSNIGEFHARIGSMRGSGSRLARFEVRWCCTW